MDSNPLSKQDSIELFGEFLEVAIHTILYVRNVYPEDIFEKRRKFNVIVARSRSKLLNQHILEIVESVKDWIFQGWISKLVVIILPLHSTNINTNTTNMNQQNNNEKKDEGNNINNNNINNVQDSPQMNPETMALERYLIEIIQSQNKNAPAKTLFELQQIYRGFLLMLNSCTSSFLPLSSIKSTFKVIAYTQGTPEIMQSPIWVVSDLFNVPDPKLFPLKSADFGSMKMQLYAEQPTMLPLQFGSKLSGKDPLAAATNRSDEEERVYSPKYDERMEK